MSTILGLNIVLGVEARVKDYNFVSTRQVHARSACPCTQHKDWSYAILGVEAINHILSNGNKR